MRRHSRRVSRGFECCYAGREARGSRARVCADTGGDGTMSGPTKSASKHDAPRWGAWVFGLGIPIAIWLMLMTFAAAIGVWPAATCVSRCVSTPTVTRRPFRAMLDMCATLLRLVGQVAHTSRIGRTGQRRGLSHRLLSGHVRSTGVRIIGAVGAGRQIIGRTTIASVRAWAKPASPPRHHCAADIARSVSQTPGQAGHHRHTQSLSDPPCECAPRRGHLYMIRQAAAGSEA